MRYQMYVSLAGEDCLARFTVEGDTGALTLQGDVAVPGRPAPLTVDPARKYLYVGRRGVRQVSGYAIDPATGGLALRGTVSLPSDPCYLATDRSSRFLLSAYYEAGGIAVHPIGDDGAPTTPPVTWLATGRGAHSIQTDPTNRFAFVPHIAGPKGPNMIPYLFVIRDDNNIFFILRPGHQSLYLVIRGFLTGKNDPYKRTRRRTRYSFPAVKNNRNPILKTPLRPVGLYKSYKTLPA